MDVIKQLAISLGRRDEVPNIDLAKKIVKSRDATAVKELVENLKNKNKNIQADCVKVLDEIAEASPEMISPYISQFQSLLRSKNNRLVWGAMIVLNNVTETNPEIIYKMLPELLDVSDKGSVITRDNLVRILIKLESRKKYKGKIFPLLLEQLSNAPTNQLPMYADEATILVTAKNKNSFIQTLERRLHEITGDSKKKRLLAIIQKMSKLQ